MQTVGHDCLTFDFVQTNEIGGSLFNRARCVCMSPTARGHQDNRAHLMSRAFIELNAPG